MTTYKWNILESFSDGKYFTSVKYKLTATNDQNVVETEGYWEFPKDDAYLLNDNLMEGHVAGWVDNLSNGSIKAQVDAQLESLNTVTTLINPPWYIPTYTPGE